MPLATATDVRVHNLGPPEQIPSGEGRTYRVGSHEIAVFRTRQGAFYAVQAACPHAGGPLADGLIGDGRVLCPLHGYAFELATGRPLRDSCPHLRTYRVTLTETGDLMISV